MPRSIGRIVAVNVASARPLAAGGRSVMSAIDKRALAGVVEVRRLGLAGDEQADPSVHGGLAKAVYAYPHEHYGFWRTVRAQARVAGWDAVLPPGALGENLTIEGLVEADAWIGDRLRLPGCVLVVSEPRFPCFKFTAHMGFAQAGKLMVQSGWCGFYLAVLEPGRVAAGDAFEVEPGPREVSVVELFRSRMAGRRA